MYLHRELDCNLAIGIGLTTWRADDATLLPTTTGGGGVGSAGGGEAWWTQTILFVFERVDEVRIWLLFGLAAV